MCTTSGIQREEIEARLLTWLTDESLPVGQSAPTYPRLFYRRLYDYIACLQSGNPQQQPVPKQYSLCQAQ